MDIQDYQSFVKRLAKPGANIVSTFDADKAHLLHMTIGFMGECTELVEALGLAAAHLRVFHPGANGPADVFPLPPESHEWQMPYNRELRSHLIEEFGDCEFYGCELWSLIAPDQLTYEDSCEVLTLDKIRSWRGFDHRCIRLCVEAGNVLDVVKKCVVYDQPLDRERARDALSSAFRRLRSLCAEVCNEPPATIRQANFDKLSKRYPGVIYTDQAAKDRADKATNL